MNLKIYVISLERSIQRRNLMLNQLKRYDFEFIPAIDGGGEISDDRFTLERFVDYDGNFRSLTKFEIGCALSHLNCYQKMLDENISYALILEDDVRISKNFFRLIPTLTHALNTYNLINFTADSDEKRFGRYLKFPYKLTNFRYTINRSSAYMLNNFTAKMLLDRIIPIKVPIDCAVFREIPSVGVHPALFDLIPIESEINKTSTIRRRKKPFIIRKRPAVKSFIKNGLWFRLW